MRLIITIISRRKKQVLFFFLVHWRSLKKKKITWKAPMQTAMIASESTPSLFTLFFFWDYNSREPARLSFSRRVPMEVTKLWKGEKKAVPPQTSLLSHFHNTRTSQPSFFFICCCSYLTTYLRTSSTATTLSGLWKRGEKQHTESAGSGERVLQQVEETGQKKKSFEHLTAKHTSTTAYVRNCRNPPSLCPSSRMKPMEGKKSAYGLHK